MPAKAGIQKQAAKSLDASFRWHDKSPAIEYTLRMTAG